MKPIKKELVSVRIPKELNKKFAEHVAALGMSKTAFILNLINQEILKTENRKATTTASSTLANVITTLPNVNQPNV